MTQKNEITGGVIWKQVILFFFPLTIGAFFQHFYAIVDTMIVGKVLGTLELSAVGGSASKIIVLLVNFFVGVSVGITALCSRYYGNNDHRKLHSVFINGVLFFSILGIALAILSVVFSKNLLLFMKTPQETLAIANTYLRTYLSGIIFCILYNLLSGIIRAFGDSKTPLYVLIFCSILNIVLDIIFTMCLHMGVFGIAFATVLSQAISAVILLKFVLKKLPDIKLKECKIEGQIIGEICSIGIPAGMQSMMFSLSNMVVQSGVNAFGAVSVASWSAYAKLDNIVDVFVSSLGSTAITFVGQNYGAQRIDRVKQSVKQIILISYILVGCLVITFVLFRTSLLSLFTEDEAVISLGSQILCVILPMYLLTIPQQIFSQALRGLGKSLVPMLLTLVGVVGVRLVWVIVLLPINPTIEFLGACYPFSALLMSIIFTIYYKKTLRTIMTKQMNK